MISSGFNSMSMFLSILWKEESGSKVSMAHSLCLCVSIDCSPFLMVRRNFFSLLVSSGVNCDYELIDACAWWLAVLTAPPPTEEAPKALAY